MKKETFSINPKTGEKYKRSDRIRKKLSIAHINNPNVIKANQKTAKNPRVRKKISNSMLGHEVTVATRKKISKTRKRNNAKKKNN